MCAHPPRGRGCVGVSLLDSPGDDFRFRRDPSGKLLGRKKLTTDQSRHYYLWDALGSTVAMTDSNGGIAQSYSYEPYGSLKSASGPLTNPFKFAGGHDTGLGVYHYGARQYDPALARWTQQDPLDQIGDLQQANRYMYVGGNPVNLVDPRGEQGNWGGRIDCPRRKHGTASCPGTYRPKSRWPSWAGSFACNVVTGAAGSAVGSAVGSQVGGKYGSAVGAAVGVTVGAAASTAIC